MAKPLDTTQSIEQLRERYETLNTKKVVLQTRKGDAEKQLEELKQQARDQFETDNIDELKSKLETIRASNEQKKAEYQAQLDRLESRLAEIDGAVAEEEE